MLYDSTLTLYFNHQLTTNYPLYHISSTKHIYDVLFIKSFIYLYWPNWLLWCCHHRIHRANSRRLLSMIGCCCLVVEIVRIGIDLVSFKCVFHRYVRSAYVQRQTLLIFIFVIGVYCFILFLHFILLNQFYSNSHNPLLCLSLSVLTISLRSSYTPDTQQYLAVLTTPQMLVFSPLNVPTSAQLNRPITPTAILS